MMFTPNNFVEISSVQDKSRGAKTGASGYAIRSGVLQEIL